MTGKGFQGFVRLLGSNGLHQLDFFKLMLANQSACISPVTPRFAPETRRMRCEAQATLPQLRIFNDPVSKHVSHGHFGSGY